MDAENDASIKSKDFAGSLYKSDLRRLKPITDSVREVPRIF